MSNSLLGRLARAGRKITLERLFRGTAVVCTFFLAASLLATYLLARENFSQGSLFWIRLLGGLGLAGSLLHFLLIPLLRRPSAIRLARFLEERHPELEERLSTALEVRREKSVDPGLARLLEEDVRRHLARIAEPRWYYPRASLISLLAVAATVFLIVFLFFRGPEVYPYSLNKVLRGWWETNQPPLYSIEVSPGSVSVGKGSDLEVRARVLGFEARRVELVARYSQDPEWERATMRPDPRGNAFLFAFFDVRDPLQYYVTADGVRSPKYSIRVLEIPRVSRLRLTLHFPAYTGLKNVVQDEEGDLRALAGTRVHLEVETDQAVRAGEVRVREGARIALRKESPRKLTGWLEVRRDASYRIFLEDLQQQWHPASDEYLIEALQDQPPQLLFTRPGRDQKVSNIEEVFTELQARDDYGISHLSLHYSVNGSQERTLPLDSRPGARQILTTHTFYLEEFNLEPGDFLSYYAQARDAASESATDIYFLEVVPYDREFYQSQQGVPMRAGNRQQMLSRRQKEIIAATFNLKRERLRTPPEALDRKIQTVALVQQRLAGEARTIAERIRRRGAASVDRRFGKMAEHLEEAVRHMGRAHQQLSERSLVKALPEEQKSLQQLLRGEALFNQIQVSFSRNPMAGGHSAEELADLVDLELDRTKNQYETLQQNSNLQREQELDEALEKLKELSRRQQQLVEREKRARGGSENRISQQQLIEETERLLRHLERLTREKPDPGLQEISRGLRRALRRMRQSRASGGGGSSSGTRARQAAEELRNARRALARRRRSQLESRLESLKRRSQEMVRRQESVIEGIRRLEGQLQTGRVDRNYLAELRRLLNRKARLQEELQAMEADLHATARQLGSRQPGAARKLKEAAIDIRDQRLQEKMQEGSRLLGRGLNDLARQREEGLAEDLKALAGKILQARDALGPEAGSSPRERLEQALDRVSRLVEKLESLERRASGGKRGQQGQGRAGKSSPSDRPVSGQGTRTGQPSGPAKPGSSRTAKGSSPPRAGNEGRGEAGSASRAANPTDIDPRQVEREWRERLRETERLERLVGGESGVQGSIESLLARMRKIDARRLFSDPAEIARLRSQIIDGFRQLELEIHQGLGGERKRLLGLTDREGVPPSFRRRVEEYYRKLARGKP